MRVLPSLTPSLTRPTLHRKPCFQPLTSPGLAASLLKVESDLAVRLCPPPSDPQRHEEPKAGGQPGDDWEQGTYVYFDSTLHDDAGGWAGKCTSASLEAAIRALCLHVLYAKTGSPVSLQMHAFMLT